MKGFAKVLCAFGSIEIACALVVLFVFDHTPYPWGAGTLGGTTDDAALERIMQWQANVFVSTVGAGFMGALFLLLGGVIFSIFKLKRKADPN